MQWSQRDLVAYETMGRLSEAEVYEASCRSMGVTGTGPSHDLATRVRTGHRAFPHLIML